MPDQSGSEKVIEVLNPVANIDKGKTTLAPRLQSLEGKTIALWWNGKAKGDVALRKLCELLERKYNTRNVFFHQPFPHEEDVYDPVLKAGCDAAIGSTGD